MLRPQSAATAGLVLAAVVVSIRYIFLFVLACVLARWLACDAGILT